MATYSMTKEARIYNGEKTISSTSGAGKTPSFGTLPNTIHKKPRNLKMDERPNCKARYYKLLEKNIGRTLFDTNYTRIFFNPPPRVMKIKTKINKWDLIKLKSF